MGNASFGSLDLGFCHRQQSKAFGFSREIVQGIEKRRFWSFVGIMESVSGHRICGFGGLGVG